MSTASTKWTANLDDRPAGQIRRRARRRWHARRRALVKKRDAIEEMYEPYLMQIGMLDRTPRGRVATARAYEYFGRELPKRQPRLF